MSLVSQPTCLAMALPMVAKILPPGTNRPTRSGPTSSNNRPDRANALLEPVGALDCDGALGKLRLQVTREQAEHLAKWQIGLADAGLGVAVADGLNRIRCAPPAARRMNSWVSAVLPLPGSPTTKQTPPCPSNARSR